MSSEVDEERKKVKRKNRKQKEEGQIGKTDRRNKRIDLNIFTTTQSFNLSVNVVRKYNGLLLLKT